MPCRDYESDSWAVDNSAEIRKLKKQADMLARIACKAMDTLEENEIEDLLLLKDDEVRDWWLKHKEADRKEKARVAEKERRERMKAEALARLSDEEKEVLGLAQPKKSQTKRGQPKKYSAKSVGAKVVTYDIETMLERSFEEVLEWERELDEDEEL